MNLESMSSALIAGISSRSACNSRHTVENWRPFLSAIRTWEIGLIAWSLGASSFGVFVLSIGSSGYRLISILIIDYGTVSLGRLGGLRWTSYLLV